MNNAGVLLCNKPSNCKTCRPTVDRGEDVIVAVEGDTHSYPLSCITFSQLTLFPLHWCYVNRLAPCHYHPINCFVNNGVDHSSKVESLFDSRMPTLSVNAHDPQRIQAVRDGGAWLLQRLRSFSSTGESLLWNPSQCLCFIHGQSNQYYVYNKVVFLDGFGQHGQPPPYQHFTWCLGGQSNLSGQCISHQLMRTCWVCDDLKHPGFPLKCQVNSL